MAKVGVFVCHCGSNIAGTVDVEAVTKAAAGFPGVAYSTEHKYMQGHKGKGPYRCCCGRLLAPYA